MSPNLKKNNLLKFLKQKKLLDFGNYFFLIGIIFLPSALPISGAFLLFSLIIAIKENFKELLMDKNNYFILIIAILMIFSSFYNFINSDTSIYEETGNYFLDLFNWIPLFFSYIGFQVYLKNRKRRLLFAKFLIISTVPVLFSCISQYWFKSFGPFTTLNGLITWYQKPFENDLSGVTGLFSNPNYAGFWLASILPFALNLFILKKTNKFSIFLLLNLFLSIYFLLHTGSRNAFLSLSISTLLIFGSKIIFVYFLIFLLFLFILYLAKNSLFINFFQIFEFIIPFNLLNKLSTFSLTSLVQSHRFDIYKEVIALIIKKPFLGWGAGSFAILYTFKSNFSAATHTHNLFFEISYNYGLLTSILFFVFLFSLLYNSCKSLFRKQSKNFSLQDKFWLSSTISAVIFHMSDMPYYDGKVSLLFWILLAGTKCIEKNIIDKEKYFNNKI